MSDDIDADLDKVKAADGIVIKEPQGAVIALWQCTMGMQP